jgi:bacteriocin-like protein
MFDHEQDEIRELTTDELDTVSGGWSSSCGCSSGGKGNNNGNGNGNGGLLSILSGNLNGNGNGNTIVVL